MSQTPPPTPPPLPPPVPVLPVDAYGLPPHLMGPSRPGLVTAMGVTSIVVAGISILAGIYAVLALIAFSFQARYAGMRPPAAMTTPAAATAGATTAPAGEAAKPTLPVSPRGLDVVERGEVLRGLAELRFLSGSRLEQLDVMLARAGRDMFPADDGVARTAGDMEEMVLGHAAGLSANPDVAGPDTFRTRGGRFEIYDDRAVFYPAEGEIVRTTTLTSTRAGLTPEQVEQVVRRAQDASGGAMNPSQLAALRTLLSTPGQRHVSPIALPTAVRGVEPAGDGAFDVTFPNGSANIGPQGQLVSSLDPSAAAGSPGRSSAGVNGAAMAVAEFATVVGLGLALLLLLCGILVFRESPRARRWHLVYAVVKIPVAIAGVLAVWWLTSDFIEVARRNPNASVSYLASNAGRTMTVRLWLGALGIIYPIVLLIALQTRVVKGYYRSLEE
jgi:tetrahydromethanopterin S-methyltransferase subunit B